MFPPIKNNAMSIRFAPNRFLQSRFWRVAVLTLAILCGLAIVSPQAAEAQWVDLEYGDYAYDRVTTSGGDWWTFYGDQGDWVEINMGSGRFDTYLELWGPNGTLVAWDDDSGYGTNSSIYVGYLPQSGVYTIVAKGYNGATGYYWLTLD